MGGTVLLCSTSSIVGRRRSRGIAGAMAACVLLFIAYVVADCGNIHDPRAPQSATVAS